MQADKYKGCLRSDDVSDDEKLCRIIKIIAVSKFIKEIVKKKILIYCIKTVFCL